MMQTSRLILAVAALSLASAPALADPYIACDNGLRCVMAPCPSMNAVNVRTGEAGRITGVDLDGLAASERDRIMKIDATSRGTLVLEGTVETRRVKARPGARPETVLVVKGLERRSSWSERRLCSKG